MEKYDAIIVGAGPAGGQCARELSAAGKRVLLAEKQRDFSVNNYSSGGAPLELMEMFQLPESIVGCSWNRIAMHSSNDCKEWSAPEKKGVITDFSKLRAFLAEETRAQKGDVRLGYAYQKHEVDDTGATVWFKNRESQGLEKFHTSVLIDATGCERQILAKKKSHYKHSFSATGIEYLVDVGPAVYAKYAHVLSVFMGHQWMTQGYSWVFPMEPNRLKIGVGRYFQNDDIVPHEKSYTFYLERMIKKCLGTSGISIVDKHGKTLTYTYRQKDPHYDGCVIAIGDSISSLNPLALEGIRHAMVSGRIAAKHIINYLNGTVPHFERYVAEMRQYYGFKWWLCERLMRVIYREPKDDNIDLMVQAFKHFSIDDMMNLAFNYSFRAACKFFFKYTMLSLRTCLKSMVLSIFGFF